MKITLLKNAGRQRLKIALNSQSTVVSVNFPSVANTICKGELYIQIHVSQVDLTLI